MAALQIPNKCRIGFWIRDLGAILAQALARLCVRRSNVRNSIQDKGLVVKLCAHAIRTSALRTIQPAKRALGDNAETLVIGPKFPSGHRKEASPPPLGHPVD